jgi:hypothetical protein
MKLNNESSATSSHGREKRAADGGGVWKNGKRDDQKRTATPVTMRR